MLISYAKGWYSMDGYSLQLYRTFIIILAFSSFFTTSVHFHYSYKHGFHSQPFSAKKKQQPKNPPAQHQMVDRQISK